MPVGTPSRSQRLHGWLASHTIGAPGPTCVAAVSAPTPMMKVSEPDVLGAENVFWTKALEGGDSGLPVQLPADALYCPMSWMFIPLRQTRASSVKMMLGGDPVPVADTLIV